MELLLVLKRFFVVFLFACFEHFLCYHLSCFGVAAGQEFSYTGNYFSVVRFGDPSLAGRGTPPDIGIQTRSEICRQFAQVKTARARRKSFKYLENVSHAHPDYRSEIPGTVFYQLTRHGHARKRVLDVYFDVRILFVVFQQDIVRRFIFFYKVVFKRKRVSFACRHDVPEIGYPTDHYIYFKSFAGRMEKILPYSVFQIFRLAYI